MHTILTDNGGEWTVRFSDDKIGKPKGRPSGDHPVDRLCAERGITHKLTRPYRPQANGIGERFNRRIKEYIVQAGGITAKKAANDPSQSISTETAPSSSSSMPTTTQDFDASTTKRRPAQPHETLHHRRGEARYKPTRYIQVLAYAGLRGGFLILDRQRSVLQCGRNLPRSGA